MAKNKQKSPENTFAKTLKNVLANNELLLIALGAAAGGAALVAAAKSKQGQQVMGNLSDSVNNLFAKQPASSTTEPAAAIKGKTKKSPDSPSV